MKKETITKIQESNLIEKYKTDLIKSLEYCYSIRTEKTEIKIGNSKIGGFPHLPKDFIYPQEDDFYYEFVCQINLSEIEDSGISNFPIKGILYFFIYDDFNVGNIKNKTFILDIENRELEIKENPKNKKSRCESFDDRVIDSELKILLTKEVAINQHLIDKILTEQVIHDDKNSLNFEIESFYTKDQVFGFPATWRIENAEWWAYLSKRKLNSLYYLTLDSQLEILRNKELNLQIWIKDKVNELIANQNEILKINDKTTKIYNYWEKELEDLMFTKQNLESFVSEIKHHKKESKNWIQLLSISSYYDARIRFGDGKMEFLIEKKDLENQNFDNIFCHIYG